MKIQPDDERRTDSENDTDDEQVYLRVGGGGVSVYHTRRCPQFPTEARPVDRATAETWGIRECQHCAGNVDRDGKVSDLASRLAAIGERRAADDDVATDGGERRD